MAYESNARLVWSSGLSTRHHKILIHAEQDVVNEGRFIATSSGKRDKETMVK